MADQGNRYYSIATVVNWTEHYTPEDLIHAYEGIYVSETVDPDTFVTFLRKDAASHYHRFRYIILDFALDIDVINGIINRVGDIEYTWLIRVTRDEYNSTYNRRNVSQAIECRSIQDLEAYAGRNYAFYTPGGGGAMRNLSEFANGRIEPNDGGDGTNPITGGGSENLTPSWNASKLVTSQTKIYRGLKLFDFDAEANGDPNI